MQTRKPRALDLFCGAGGATKGLQRAGFHVTGIDLKRQPRYCGDAFIQGDATRPPVDLSAFDFAWSSPPCQGFCDLKSMYNAKEHENLIPATRELLLAAGIPFVIENVEGAPLGESGYLTMLCGTMFGLRTADGRAQLRRHRLFETSFSIPLRPRCQHHGAVIGVYGGHGRDRRRTVNTQDFSTEARREAMGIDWMDGGKLSQAIPPAYSEFIGREFLRGWGKKSEQYPQIVVGLDLPEIALLPSRSVTTCPRQTKESRHNIPLR